MDLIMLVERAMEGDATAFSYLGGYSEAELAVVRARGFGLGLCYAQGLIARGPLHIDDPFRLMGQ